MKVYFYGISENHILAGPSFLDPSPSYERIKKLSPKSVDINFSMCPAIKDSFHNVYDLKFPFEYKLVNLKNLREMGSPDFNQQFFEKLIWIRDFEKRMLNFNMHYYFFTEEESLPLEISQPSFCDNDFSNKTMLIGGLFDFAKWPRPINVSFIVKENVNDIQITPGTVYCQAKFHTKEKIQFVKFRPTDEINQIIGDLIKVRSFKPKQVWNLNQYYDMFKKMKIKKYLLKKIKENILED